MSIRYNEGEMPNQFEDEDLWFKFFKKKQLVILIPALFINLFLVKQFYAAGHMGIGVLLAVFIMLIVFALTMIPVTEAMYIYGVGRPLFLILVFIIFHKINPRKKIYTIESDKEK